MTYISNIKDWTDTLNANDVLHATQDRERWKSMAVNALAQDT